MPEVESVIIKHGVSIIPFKSVRKLEFPERPFHADEDSQPVVSSPLLRYADSEGFIQVVPVDTRKFNKSPKLVRFAARFERDKWIVTEAPLLLVARFQIASVADYRGLVNFSAKFTLGRREFHLQLIEY